MISKKISFLRLVYQIDRFFALIKDPRSKIGTNAYFGYQRAAKSSHRHPKTFKWIFLCHFLLKWFFLLQGPFLGPLAKKIANPWKFALLTWIYSVFSLGGRCEKLKKKFCFENIKCLYVINKHFLFPKPISKMSRWFSFKQNVKKPCFSPFLATRWGRNQSKTPFSDSQRQIIPI